VVEVTCVADARAALGESTFWDPVQQVLWWLDIWGPTIHRYNPATNADDTWTAPEYLGCLATRASGGLVVSMASGFFFFDPGTGTFDPIVDPEADQPDARFNDGKTDRQGRFWSGSMFEAPGRKSWPAGSLWRLDADHTAHKLFSGVVSSNGLAWSPDSKTMYFTDSASPIVRAYDFDPATGEIENERVFFDVSSEGKLIDGSTVDADGCYWTTLPLVSKVCQYDPDGKLMRTILLPTDLPTCCEFGGPDLDVLYVTSAVLNRPAEHFRDQQYPGGLFAITGLGVKGLTLPPYAG
jgi:sugar lactone lactonase YvrE